MNTPKFCVVNTKRTNMARHRLHLENTVIVTYVSKLQNVLLSLPQKDLVMRPGK